MAGWPAADAVPVLWLVGGAEVQVAPVWPVLLASARMRCALNSTMRQARTFCLKFLWQSSSMASASSIKQEVHQIKQEMRARAELGRLRQKQLHNEQQKLRQELAQSEKQLARKVESMERKMLQGAAASKPPPAAAAKPSPAQAPAKRQRQGKPKAAK